jgi:hypothetical protein
VAAQVLPMASARAMKNEIRPGDDVGTSHGSGSMNATYATARVRGSDNAAFVTSVQRLFAFHWNQTTLSQLRL